MSTRTPENSLHHRGATARTGKQLTPPRDHRKYRKTACTTAMPPQGPENSLHHRQATGKHRTTAPRTFASTAFSDSAFRFLSRQVLGLGGGTTGGGDRASIHRRNVESRTLGHISSYQGNNSTRTFENKRLRSYDSTIYIDSTTGLPRSLVAPHKGGPADFCIDFYNEYLYIFVHYRYVY